MEVDKFAHIRLTFGAKFGSNGLVEIGLKFKGNIIIASK